MDHTKIDQTDLDSPCQEFSVRGLRFVVHRSFGWRRGRDNVGHW